MECKSQFLHVKMCVFLELIDTLWNVNVFTTSVHDVTVRELIDTLWNVNTYEPPAAGSTDKELIDTLWNVNTNATTDQPR